MTGPQGAYLMPGLYALQLRHWLRAFPLDAFYIMSSKAFKDDTKAQMLALARFLSEGFVQQSAPVLTSGSSTVNDAVLDFRFRTKAGGSKKGVVKHLSAATEKKLREFFEPFNKELWTILGRQVDW